jgi:site-specific recombinase XerD
MGKRGVVSDLALPRSWQREPARSGASSVSAPKPKLLNQVRLAVRARHDSPRTEDAEDADAMRIRRFIFSYGVRHPASMGESKIRAFLTHSALKELVSASTLNQALTALLFPHRCVLGREVGDLGEVIRARKPKRLPVAPTRQETKAVLNHLHGDKWPMASLMYAAGLRLKQCLRLRAQGAEFTTNEIEIPVRDGKGATDRVTLEDGHDIRTVRELLGHKDVRTTTIDTDVLHRGRKGVRSPPDTLEMESTTYCVATV